MTDQTVQPIPAFSTPMESALHLRSAGFTIIPTFPNSKIPVEKWERWETNQTEEHIRAHWKRFPQHEVGIITSTWSSLTPIRSRPSPRWMR